MSFFKTLFGLESELSKQMVFELNTTIHILVLKFSLTRWHLLFLIVALFVVPSCLLPLSPFSSSLFLPKFHIREKNFNTYIHKTDLFHSTEYGTLHESTLYSSTEAMLISVSLSF